jgi:hypothetical protein
VIAARALFLPRKMVYQIREWRGRALRIWG